jgi:phosphatidylserine/phosphatidylglycerophosphate/cardiolipin synthase-like enzyme
MLCLFFLVVSVRVLSAPNGSAEHSSHVVPTFGVVNSSKDIGSSLAVFFTPVDASTKDNALSALVRSLEGAERNILCAVYDIDLKEIAEVLVQKYGEGKEVKIVTEEKNTRNAAIAACRAAGIPIVVDKNSALMHNKFFVVDDSVVWTGSANATANDFFRNNNNVLCFTSTSLSRAYRDEFWEMYERGIFGAGAPNPSPCAEESWGMTCVYFAPEDHVAQKLADHIRNARQEILFMGYVFTHEGLARLLIRRRAEGLRVQGLLEASQTKNMASKRKFLEQGDVTVFLDANPRTMHHKVMIFDRTTVATGSFNFSISADTRNDENIIFLENPSIAQQFVQEFERLTTATQRE